MPRAGGVLRRARPRRRRPDRHRRLRAQQARLAQAVRRRADHPAAGERHRQITDAVHAEAARSRCRCCTPAATATRRSRVGASDRQVADHAVQAEAPCRPRRSTGPSTDFAAAARWPSKAGVRRRRDHGLRGLPDQPVPRRAHQRPRRRAGAARGERGCASRSRSSAAPASAGRRRTSRSSTASRCSTSSRAARPGTRSWRSPRTLEQAGATMHQHRHRLARGARADDHHPGPARRLDAVRPRGCKAGREHPGLRVQPDQHPRARRGAPRRRRRRPGLDGPAVPGRPRASSTRPPPAAPTRSTPASPATRPASTTPSATSGASCLVNPRACHETELVLCARPRTQAGRVAVVGAGPAGLAAAVVRRRARLRGHPVREGRRDRRPVPARDADPRQGGVRRDAALLQPPARGARRRRAPRRRGHRRRPRRRSTRCRRDRRRARGSRPSPASTTPKVVSYAEVLSGAVTVGQAGRGDRRRRHRRGRQPLPHPRPGGHPRGLDAALGRRRPDAVHPGGAHRARSRARRPARSTCCSARPRRSARASARPRAGRTAPCSRTPASQQVTGRRPTTGSTTPACTSPSTARTATSAGARGRPRRGVRRAGVGARAVRRARAGRRRRCT